MPIFSNIYMTALASIAQFYQIKWGAKAPQYVYHIKSPNFKGQSILSLNLLEEKFPQIYKEEYKKYKDREKHLKEKVPPLNCTWSDCISLSSIDPRKLFELEKLLDLPVDPVKIFRFDIETLANKEFCFYYDTIVNERYEPGNVDSYVETEFIPSETVIHYAESKEEGDSPLLFAGIMHVLVKNELDIKEAEIIF